jgi:hypothetical protein
MSDPTAPVEGTSGSSTPEAAPSSAPSPDMFAPVVDRMNELAGSIDNRFAAFEQRLPPAPEPEAEPDPWADLFGQQEPDPDPYGQQQPQGLDPQALQSAINAAIQQSNAPLQAQLQQFQAERAAERLGQMIPALADTPENKENRQTAFNLVSSALQNYPAEQANALAADPNFIAMAWKAAEADRLAQGQAPTGVAPSLETAGGALPGGNSEPVNPVDSAYGGRQGLPAAWG